MAEKPYHCGSSPSSRRNFVKLAYIQANQKRTSIRTGPIRPRTHGHTHTHTFPSVLPLYYCQPTFPQTTEQPTHRHSAHALTHHTSSVVAWGTVPDTGCRSIQEKTSKPHGHPLPPPTHLNLGCQEGESSSRFVAFASATLLPKLDRRRPSWLRLTFLLSF